MGEKILNEATASKNMISESRMRTCGQCECECTTKIICLNIKNVEEVEVGVSL